MDNFAYFNETFDDDLYNLIYEGNDGILDYITYPVVNDLIIYDYNFQKMIYINKLRAGKDVDNAFIGITLKYDNNTRNIDILMKSFLTSEPVQAPSCYYGKEDHICVYYKLLFDRYCSKHLRASKYDMSIFKYCVPSIALLDYLWTNINNITDIIEGIYGEEKKNIFLLRIYKYGIFATHKKKFYKWLPVINGKRQILNFDVFSSIEFLPILTISYDDFLS